MTPEEILAHLVAAKPEFAGLTLEQVFATILDENTRLREVIRKMPASEATHG